MAMTEAELTQAIRTELMQADGYESDELSEMRRQALDMYFGKTDAFGAAVVEGRSRVVSNDLADMIEALVAQILPGLSGDSICEFEPDGEEDVEQAQLESDVVNNMILERNMGYVMFQSALRDALLLRNGWIKCWLDEQKDVERGQVPPAPEEAIAMLLAQLNQQPGLEAELVGEWKEGEETTVKLTRTTERLRLQAVDPVNMRWQADYDSPFIEDGMRFLAERWFPTRTELIKAGYSKTKVNELNAFSFDTELDQRARYRNQQAAQLSTDPSTEILECYWCFYLYDSDNDGVAELHRILYAGGNGGETAGTILDNDIVAFTPYATGTPFLQPHQLNGLGMYDKVAEVAHIKTDVWRSWLDNLSVNNFPEVAVNVRAVDAGDVTNRKPGGAVRVNGEPGPNIMQLPVQDNGQSSAAALEYADKVRSERGGASLDMQTAELQVAGDTAHGVERAMSAKEQMAAMISRTLAETLVRQTYLLCHRGMREWLEQPLNMRLRGKFATAEPANWPARDRVNVKAGLSVAERMHRRGAMAEIVAKQEQLAAAGYDGILVEAEQYHAGLTDWLRSMMVDAGERYFMDPRSPESQQGARQKAERAEEMQSVQMQIAQLAASSEQQAEAISSAIDKYKTDVEMAFKYWAENLQAELEKLKMGSGDGGDIGQQQAAGNIRSVSAQQASRSTGAG